MVDHVEDAAGYAYWVSRANAQHHIADLADRMERKKLLEILLNQGHEYREHDGGRAYRHEDDTQCAVRLNREEIEAYPSQEINAEQFLECCRNEGHHRHGRVDGRVGNPGVEGHGAGLAYGPYHHQNEGRGSEASQGNRAGGYIGHLERLGDGPKNAYAQYHAKIAEAADDKTFNGRAVGLFAAYGDEPVKG